MKYKSITSNIVYKIKNNDGKLRPKGRIVPRGNPDFQKDNLRMDLTSADMFITHLEINIGIIIGFKWAVAYKKGTYMKYGTIVIYICHHQRGSKSIDARCGNWQLFHTGSRKQEGNGSEIDNNECPKSTYRVSWALEKFHWKKFKRRPIFGHLKNGAWYIYNWYKRGYWRIISYLKENRGWEHFRGKET